MGESNSEITQLLYRWREGNQDALEELMPIVCGELRQMARLYLRGERQGHTLQPTALVNEVYLRLHGCESVNWESSSHFFGFAAQIMRRVLVDHARSQLAAKRGEGAKPLPLDEALGHASEKPEDLIALDDALDDLAKLDPRQALVVELKFFVGLTIDEMAGVLEVSPVTVKREWKTAKLWLLREISRR